MAGKTLTMPEEAMINLLKTLPEDALVEVFWKTLVESDVSPITDEEKKEIEKGKVEFQKGETIRWENLR